MDEKNTVKLILNSRYGMTSQDTSNNFSIDCSKEMNALHILGNPLEYYKTPEWVDANFTIRRLIEEKKAFILQNNRSNKYSWQSIYYDINHCLNIRFTFKEDAMKILTELKCDILKWEFTSISHLMDLLGREKECIDYVYGWDNLNMATIRKTNFSYELCLPAPQRYIQGDMLCHL